MPAAPRRPDVKPGAPALIGQELEDVGLGDLGRILRHHREESVFRSNATAAGCSAGPGRHELQIPVRERCPSRYPI